jgi:hypothetical protein
MTDAGDSLEDTTVVTDVPRTQVCPLVAVGLVAANGFRSSASAP